MDEPREDEHLPDIYVAMGQIAEKLARLNGVAREEIDQVGVRSQNRAEKAIANGFFAREISPITLPDGTVVEMDDGPCAGVTYEAVSQLKPVFEPDGRVQVTVHIRLDEWWRRLGPQRAGISSRTMAIGWTRRAESSETIIRWNTSPTSTSTPSPPAHPATRCGQR